jgi:diaminopimelate dehydrogenase
MTNIGIVGYGNIGRGVKKAVEQNNDMKLAAIFTRRPEQVRAEVNDVPVLRNDKAFLPSLRNQVDVMILCGGSKEDTPVQGPEFAEYFSTVDSFDTHADIPVYFQRMNAIAYKNGNISIISAGWDPGTFSLERILGDAFLPGSKPYTFWGKGVSQGHSDAARKVEGVLDARQYTIPIEEAVQRVRVGETPDFSKREMHKRLVYVVTREGADKERIRREIVGMPKYFDEYDTEVIFISSGEMKRDHSAYPHGGFVMTSGMTGGNHRQILEYRCQLESNPEFTASILVACARAASRMKGKGYRGAFTLLDFPLGLLSPRSGKVLRSKFM